MAYKVNQSTVPPKLVLFSEVAGAYSNGGS